ncbi:MAG: LexA family transcriptional regulator [Bacteroidota bacterium]
MPSESPVSVRLKKARKRRSLTQSELADKTGMHLRSVVRHESGKYPVPNRALALYAHVLEVSFEWLAEGEVASVVSSARRPIPSDAYVAITVCDRRLTGSDQTEEIFLHRYVLQTVLGIELGGQIGIWAVTGDCMEPSATEGDVVFYRASDRIAGSGRHVLEVNGRLILRRVQRLSDGSLVLKCDNRSTGYRDEVLTPGNDGTLIQQETGRKVDFRVVGPVLWPRRQVSQMLMREVKEAITSMAGAVQQQLFPSR